jgi:hypothetical protein
MIILMVMKGIWFQSLTIIVKITYLTEMKRSK